jgi:hypothetical protein
MRRSGPDLIVPIRDRRQHRRILTLRNFRNACFVLVALFAGITIEANLRDSKPRPDFGRLYGHQIESVVAVPKHPEMRDAQPIVDQTAADPTLVDAAARSQILVAQPATPTRVPTQQIQSVRDGSHLAIVGGPEGVEIVQENQTRPVLRGGFGRH